MSVAEEAPPPTASRLERRKARTRAAILESASALFRENGFEDTSIAQIAEAADSGVGTLYGYFTNKEQILREVIHAHGQATAEQFAATVSESMPALDRLCIALEYFGRYVRENRVLLQSAFYVDARSSEAHADDSPATWLSRAFATFLKEGIEKGEMRPLPIEPTARSLVSIYTMAYLGTAQWRSRDRDPQTGADLEKMVRGMLSA